MALPPTVQAILDFLRKGYPSGVPDHDYLPLFALLRRRLSDDEVVLLADELAASSPDQQTVEAIRLAIERTINQSPSNADVERVQQQLEAAGWESSAVG